VINSSFGITRDELARKLKQKRIDTRTFFCSMSDQPCFRNIVGFKAIPTPVASRIWKSGLYLPSSHTLSKSDIKFVADTIKKLKG
jgi:perosamine synthetase